ncbi:MAG: alcohol dehydrogenase catalytic domain-containing protein [Acidobacteria bacterium]|nr:alcohol dehydrogenase catalytic domain-containing protein [Acidobacteriota bacterium]
MADKMKAVVKTGTELGAQYLEVDIPRIKPDQVLIKVRATSICGTDVHIYKWDEWSAKRIGAKALPQIMGHEVAGDVVEVGPHVKRIKVGDYISAETHIYDPNDISALMGQFHIGDHMKILGVDCDGAFGEYFAVPESVCWINDPTIPPELATVQEPLGNATYTVLGEDNDVAGKTMAIMGDGPAALFAVAVARVCGVAKIFIVGKYEFNMEIARKLGADHLLYANKEDVDRIAYVKDHTYGAGVDIVLEMAGSPQALDDGFRMLRRGGRFSAFGIAAQSPLPVDYNNGIVFKGSQIHGINGRKLFDTWYRNRNLLATGRLDVRPVITHLFTLDEYVKGFDAMLGRPRQSAKVVLFPDPAELEAAKGRMGR